MPSWTASRPRRSKSATSRSHSPAAWSYEKAPNRGHRLVGVDGEDGAGKAQVARDDRGQRGRRLEREPAVVADLAEGAGGLYEDDAASTWPNVTRAEEHVLDVHAAHEGAERADLRRRVEAAPQRIGQIEVAAERRRRGARRERLDAVGRKKPLETERHSARGGGRAERRKRVGAAVEVVVGADLRLEEERERTTSAPRSAASPIARRTSSAAVSAICVSADAMPPWLWSPSTSAWISSDAAVASRRSGRLPPRRRAKLRARQGHLEAGDAEPACLGDDVVDPENGVHDGELHRLPRPELSALCHLLCISNK